MDEGYWDQQAGAFDSDIFNVVGLDRNNVVAGRIDELSSKDHLACDYGCGIGRHLPMLAMRFAGVTGVDISGKCLAVARRKCTVFDNVNFVKADLSRSAKKLPKAHFAFSINTMIMPCFRTRMAIFKNISRHTCRGGHVVLVVPALESALYAHSRLVEWNMRDGMTYDEAVADGSECLRGRRASVSEGILNLDGGPTKHYVKEELRVLLKDVRFNVASIEKVEYPWRSEFVAPPKWMKEPYPWDWLVVGRKM